MYIYIFNNSLCLSLLRYLFNVRPFTLMKGTGVPENYVLIKVDCLDSVIIYQNQHVEQTLKLCFFSPYIYICI